MESLDTLKLKKEVYKRSTFERVKPNLLDPMPQMEDMVRQK